MSPLEIGLLVAAVLFLVFCGVVGLVIVLVGARRRKQASAVAPPVARYAAPLHSAPAPASMADLLSGLDADLKAAAEKERHVRATLKFHKFAYDDAKDEPAPPKS